MKKTRKEYEAMLNGMSPDNDSEEWVIGGEEPVCKPGQLRHDAKEVRPGCI